MKSIKTKLILSFIGSMITLMGVGFSRVGLAHSDSPPIIDYDNETPEQREEREANEWAEYRERRHREMYPEDYPEEKENVPGVEEEPEEEEASSATQNDGNDDDEDKAEVTVDGSGEPQPEDDAGMPNPEGDTRSTRVIGAIPFKDPRIALIHPTDDSGNFSSNHHNPFKGTAQITDPRTSVDGGQRRLSHVHGLISPTNPQQGYTDPTDESASPSSRSNPFSGKATITNPRAPKALTGAVSMNKNLRTFNTVRSR